MRPFTSAVLHTVFFRGLAIGIGCAAGLAQAQTTVTIATANNSDMIGMQAFTLYRTDLFEKAGLQMPEDPTRDFIKDAAAAIDDQGNEVYGICLRGKPGWGENMALLTAMASSCGARWLPAQRSEWLGMPPGHLPPRDGGSSRLRGEPGLAALHTERTLVTHRPSSMDSVPA